MSGTRARANTTPGAVIPPGLSSGIFVTAESQRTPDPGISLEVEAARITDMEQAFADLEQSMEDHYADAYLPWVRELALCADEILVARTRAAIMFADHVIKVPLNGEGELANMLEEDHHVKEGKTGYIPIADCEIILLGEHPALRMERVVPVTSHKGLPGWADFVDCRQVGYDRDGVLVAYDL